MKTINKVVSFFLSLVLKQITCSELYKNEQEYFLQQTVHDFSLLKVLFHGLYILFFIIKMKIYYAAEILKILNNYFKRPLLFNQQRSCILLILFTRLVPEFTLDFQPYSCDEQRRFWLLDKPYLSLTSSLQFFWNWNLLMSSFFTNLPAIVRFM